jgi:acetaldehyde dehydrogenase (acetylating)
VRARASPSRMLQPPWAGSGGLARATRLGVPATAAGVDGLIGMPGFEDIDIVFDVTSAVAHIANAERLAGYGNKLSRRRG